MERGGGGKGRASKHSTSLFSSLFFLLSPFSSWTARHSPAEVAEFGKEDVKALNALFATNNSKYFHGDKFTTADAIVFGTFSFCLVAAAQTTFGDTLICLVAFPTILILLFVLLFVFQLSLMPLWVLK